MLTPDELKQIEQRESEASPGPWTVGFNTSMKAAWAIQRAGTTTPIVHCDSEKNTDLHELTHQVESDLEFLANSREDIKVLLAEIKTVRARLEESRDVLNFYASPSNYRPPAPGTEKAWVGNDLGNRAREFLVKE